MRQDWIEFEWYKGRKVSTRTDYIMNIREGIDSSNKECVMIGCSDGEATFDLYSYMPYEQVKQKVMDAEKVDLNDVVVEHFTDDEYVTLFVMVLAALSKGDESNNDEGLISIKNKLSKIIEKNK